MNDANFQQDLAIKAEISLYYDLHIPENVQKPVPLLLAVHGYGAHKRYMMREAKLIAPKDFVIASVQGPHQHFRQTPEGYRIGFGWLTDHRTEESVALHHKFLNDVVDKLDAEGLIDRSRIHLFGFSQACALNFRYAFTYPDVPRSVIGVCGGIPGDLDANPIYKPFDARAFYLYGSDDEFYTQERFASFDTKLKNMLRSYRSKQYSATHTITDEMRADIKSFLKEFAST